MKRKTIVLILGFILLSLFLNTNPVYAAKKRTWKATTVSTKTSGSSKLSISARLTGWKQYLSLGFKGVSSTSGVTYELVYSGNNMDQGVFGTVKPSEGNNVTRSIFLGTCSHGACVSHKNINNVHLTITYQTTSGQSVTKKYKVKY